MTRPIRAKKPRLLLFFGLLAVCPLVLGMKAMAKSPLDTVATDAFVPPLAAANTDFGFRLLKQLNRETPGQNIFFSPFSVSNALTMVLNGAGGATENAIAATLGLKSMTLEEINHANSLLLPSLKNPDPKVELAVANALWANRGVTFAPAFQKRCSDFYEARAETLDFHSPAAADTINGWVKDNTRGKITQLVSPSDLAGSAAVLANAVYFHGQWSHEFEKSSTQQGPFTLTPGRVKTVPLMSRNGSYSYLETPQFQAVSLPYGTGRMSFYVVLPKPGSSLGELLNGMDKNVWEGWVKKMQPTEMTLILPRFKADYQATLNTPLTAMGMGPAFASGADFTPMGLRGSAISKVIHKAILEVDEEGTVAAAVTGGIMAMSMPVPPETVMRIDHPFFCAIRDNDTGTLLFVGVIRDPQ